MSEHALIGGLILSGYRSFGAEPQRIGPFSKLNFLVGKNNSGKSNIMRFLKAHFSNLFQNKMGFEHADTHLGSRTDKLVLGFARAVPQEGLEALLKSLLPNDAKDLSDILARAITGAGLTDPAGGLWFSYECSRLGDPIKLSVNEVVKPVAEVKEVLQHWPDIARRLAGSYYSSYSNDASMGNALNAMGSLAGHCFKAVPVELIPAIREVRSGGESKFDCSGLNLVDSLARLQNPKHTEQDGKKRFEAINVFLRHVTGNPKATLEIPYHRDTILVHIDEKTLPLESLGTGLHEVVILAAAATVFQNTVVCMEEPEIHLHPILQKKLVGYLASNTSNQYVIATHSAHILDTDGAAIFHVTHDGVQSRVTRVTRSSQHDSICSDLGYRASDLLQSNCIIWVEGPSDRVYVRHWITSVEPALKEGVDYSIMFYGGRLLNHLSANDEEVEQFITLRRMNRHTCVIMDSDRDAAKSQINQTKQRVCAELRDGGFAWVTQGREIENYIASQEIYEAIAAVAPKDFVVLGTGQFDHALQYKVPNKDPATADKIKVARHVVAKPPQWEILDLKERVQELIAFIKKANGENP